MITIAIIILLSEYFLYDSLFFDGIYLTRSLQLIGTILFFVQARYFQKKYGSYFTNKIFYGINIFIISYALGTLSHFLVYAELSLSIAYIIAGSGLSLTVLRYIRHNIKFISAFYIVIIIFIMLEISGVPANQWGKGSENHATTLLFVFGIFYYTSRVITKKNLSMFPAIFITIISFFTAGRSSMLCSMILLVGMLTIKLAKSKNPILLLSIITIVLYISGPSLYKYLSTNFYSEINQDVARDPRALILITYLDELSVQKLLFGFKGYSKQFTKAYFNLTTHNSFIDMQTTIGIFMLPILYSIILGAVKSIGDNLHLVLFVIVLSVRAFTDSLAFTSGIGFTSAFIMIILTMNYLAYSNNHTKVKYVRNISSY